MRTRAFPRRLRGIRPERLAVAGIALGVVAGGTSPGRAQEGPPEDEAARTPNFAFATQLGSGIYTANGRTVQIYRLSGSVALLSEEPRGWGLRLRAPVTFGFYNFKIEDVLEKGLPDKLTTLALVPTLELGVAARENWWLGPFLGLGAGRDFASRKWALIYSLGIRSLAIFPWSAQDVRLGNRLVYSGYTDENVNFQDDFAMLETGVDLRRPLGFRVSRSDIDGSVFGVNYLYFVSPHLVRLVPEPIEMRTEWEFGITMGTVQPWRILGIRMPRIGLSYRFGTGIDTWRVIVGTPFPIDSPREKGPEVQ